MIQRGQTYSGGCLCGAVRYEISGPSLFEQQCCCRDCQKATGTGHTTIIGLHRSQLYVTGELANYTNAGASGGEVTRHFCPVCAGRIYTSGTAPGQVWMVQAGSLDDPSVVEPQAVIYATQAVSWDHFDPRLPNYEDYAPVSDETLAAKRGLIQHLVKNERKT